MILRAFFAAYRCRQAHQVGELRLVVLIQHTFFGANSKHNFFPQLKISRIVRYACLRKFKPKSPK